MKKQILPLTLSKLHTPYPYPFQPHPNPLQIREGARRNTPPIPTPFPQWEKGNSYNFFSLSFGGGIKGGGCKAFTLVELIVVIVILAILGTIGFISLQGYSKDTRDAKRITDTRNILSKVGIKQAVGTKLSELIISNKENNLTINGSGTTGYQGIPNFDTLGEDVDSFRDPSNNEIYPIAYAEGGSGTGAYNFIEMATVNEMTGRVKIVGNYYKLNDTTDSPSLFTQSGTTGLNNPGDYITDDGNVPPYDIGVRVYICKNNNGVVLRNANVTNIINLPSNTEYQTINKDGFCFYECKDGYEGINCEKLKTELGTCSGNKPTNNYSYISDTKYTKIYNPNSKIFEPESLLWVDTFNNINNQSECLFTCNEGFVFDNGDCEPMTKTISSYSYNSKDYLFVPAITIEYNFPKEYTSTQIETDSGKYILTATFTLGVDGETIIISDEREDLLCNSGFYSADNMNCIEVGENFYSIANNARQNCPTNSTTNGLKIASSIDSCLGIAGYYNCNTGACMAAGIGYYSEANSNTRYSCLNNGVTETTTSYRLEQCIYNFAYNGGNYTFVIPKTANYKIEVWGAGAKDSATAGSYAGRGAYAKGEINLEADLSLYIYVGSKPTTNVGGYNGGGTGGNSSAYGGGGGSDVRLTAGTWNDLRSLKSRIIVAGGGGSTGNARNGVYRGGDGGTIAGLNSTVAAGENRGISTGGGQTGGGIAGAWLINNNTNGVFGIGGNGTAISTANRGGGSGGGGYYGGGGGASCNSPCSFPAGGGSSFVSGCSSCKAVTEYTATTGITHKSDGNHPSGKVFSNIIMTAGNASMPNYNGGLMTGNAGNGYVRISFIY